MKPALLLLALACPLQAELLATVQTTQGDVAVVLQYDKAPQAVANFITLAQGTRNHVDPVTGAVSKGSYYIGEKFFRVLNDAGFKIAQTGSGTGTNSGGPGFAFKDEFHAALTHVPYVLSMANGGPNSNGSQIFFTGNVSIPSLNNVHTIFGLVTDPSSRGVIDAILAAGNNGSTITGITFSRSDAAAIAFDEHAQNLPEVTRPDGSLAVRVGVSALWHLGQAMSTGAVFRAFSSTTMATGTWSELAAARQHVGLPASGGVPSVDTAALDDAAAVTVFYNLSVARHPGALAPSTLANRTVTIPLSGGVLTYAFDSSGAAGMTTYTPASGAPITGPFTTIHPYTGLPQSPSTDAHSFYFVADTPALSPRDIWLKIGCDSATATLITGRHSTQYYSYGWQPFASGTATLSR